MAAEFPTLGRKEPSRFDKFWDVMEAFSRICDHPGDALKAFLVAWKADRANTRRQVKDGIKGERLPGKF